jgi:hypothetical protein
MNWERRGRKRSWANLSPHLGSCLGDWGQSRTFSVKIVSIQAEIWNANQTSYRLKQNFCHLVAVGENVHWKMLKKSLRDTSFHVGGCRLDSAQADKLWKRSETQFRGKTGCSLLHFDRRADSVQNWGSGLYKSQYRKSIKWVKFKRPLYSADHSKIVSLIVWNTKKI